MAWDLSNVIINLKAKIAEISAQIPGLATTSKAGIVKPDGTTITIEDGVISAAEPESVIITKTSGETWRSILTRLYKAIDASKLRGTSYIKCKAILNNEYARYQIQSSGSYQFAALVTNHNPAITTTFYYGVTIIIGEVYVANKIQGTTKTDLIDTEYGGDSITLYY